VPGAPLLSEPQPEPSPFIVTVHFCTSTGWTVDTKHRVQHRTTVAMLVEQCCEQLASRHAQEIDPAKWCLRINHERAKRSVTLSDSRELHSFSYFQRCQRDGVPITLFMYRRDELVDLVHVRLRQAAEQAGASPR
jgi:hypothetical protein